MKWVDDLERIFDAGNECPDCQRAGWEWEPPRMEPAAAIYQAAAMVERFNRLFLRTLRALRDLRRYGSVIVQRAEQVNLGQQQVNIVRSGRSRESKHGR